MKIIILLLRAFLAISTLISFPRLANAEQLVLRTYEGIEPGEHLGWSVSGAGDINADGVLDVIIGAPGDNIDSNFGVARVYSGATGAELLTLTGTRSNDEFGISVDGAGDVDGDGYDDVIVGGQRADVNGTLAGYAWVFSGQTGQTLHYIRGEAPGEYLGRAVCGLGDINDDGHSDFVVAAANANNLSGRVRIHSGANGSVLRTYIGTSGSFFGQSVDAAGDVDSDGYPDLIVGAFRANVGGEESGSAFVFSGRTGTQLLAIHGDDPNDVLGIAVAGAGDVDGDGFGDVIVGVPGDNITGPNTGSARVYSGRTSDLLHVFIGDSAGDSFGQAVDGPGDIDGDGHEDLVVGAFNDGKTGEQTGSASLFSGRTGERIAIFYGAATNARYGFAVTGPGDVNGDGVPDLLVGVPFFDVSDRPEAGISILYSGFAIAPPCPGDCDSSGGVEFNDLVAILFQFGSDGTNTRCDVDGSGTVNFNDLTTALFFFGPCSS